MTITPTLTPLAGALEAARRGWRLIRLEPAGKTPAGPWRGRDTHDTATITQWWTGDASPNYGIVADASGLLILDEDTPGTLDRWEAQHGPLPPTFTVTTGKGRHLYYDAGDHRYGNASPFRADGLDVDVRGAGYVVGPGSIHAATGTVYTVVDDRAPAPVPPALHAYLTAPRAQQAEPTAVTPPAPPTGDDPWLTAAITGALQDLTDTATMPEGAVDRHGNTWETGALHARACRLLELSNTDPGIYPRAQARADYLAAAPAGHETRFAHHWDSAVQQVGDRPATRPEPRPQSLAAEFGITPRNDPDQAPYSPGTPGDSDQRPTPTLDRFAPLDWTDVLDGPPPAEEWVLWPLAERGQSVSLYSAPKAGKSLLILDLLTRATTGHRTLGGPPAPPIRVLYLDAENTRKDLRKRLHDMDADPDQLHDLIYLSFPPLAPLDTTRGAAELLALVDQHHPDLVIIDTVSRYIDGPENDADTWLNIYRLALAPLKAREVAVIRLDHAGKDADRGERGSSAKNGDVDASWQLTYDERRQTRTLVRKLTRTGNGPDRLVLNILTAPLRHEPASPLDPAADPVSHIIRKLDELGADPGIGFKLAGPLLRDNGHGGFRNDLLREALRRRKARQGDPEGDPGTPETTPSGSPPQGDPAPRVTSTEIPGHTVTPPSGSPRVTQVSAPRDPGSPLPIGEPVGSPSQGRGSPTLCESCGDPLTDTTATVHTSCEGGVA
ncbi:bifunctional DNA primase/polymerase [Brachybacterium sp. p3-SID1565]|uniref:bifunctional DNA primase/polymerase n=1 Tax=Brachybacterium sp. p3-SID1565 TaxID=2916046 RepID=UPI0021A8F03D|nr:bifunctional DNA primase/polymerase [Brachybacterium sp. p3-SID1565]MCT1385794.1 bifunctional DNA primase/polymerase [Brachybacterium sp. p3-SID1565]